MIWPTLFITLTFFLFALPLIPSLLELQYPGDTRPLTVIQKYDSDIRYFAVSFKKFLENNFQQSFFVENKQVAGIVEGKLPDNTKFQIIGKDKSPSFDPKETHSYTTSKLILSKNSLFLPPKMFYETEVYSASSIKTGENSHFRALLAEDDINLDKGCTTLRWIHSNKSLYISSGCSLFGRTSAEETITISDNCRFERLHAKKVVFGDTASNQNIKLCDRKILANLPNIKIKDKKRWLIEGDIAVPEKSLFEGNLISSKTIRIGENSHIKGNIKSNKDMYIGAGTYIEGSIVSVGNIYIGPNCHINGPIISEDKITICDGNIIGLEDAPTSICALKIEIMNGVIAFGTIWAEESAFVTIPKTVSRLYG